MISQTKTKSKQLFGCLRSIKYNDRPSWFRELLGFGVQEHILDHRGYLDLTKSQPCITQPYSSWLVVPSLNLNKMFNLTF